MDIKEKISKGINHKNSINKLPTYEYELSSNNLFVNKKDKNTRNFPKEKNKTKDSSTKSSLLLTEENESIERRKRKAKEKKVEKKYIVDDINNILISLKEPKLRLYIQEFLHYFIVFLICIYYWIFLFLSGIKFERNYYMTNNEQLDACSNEQVCDFQEHSGNIIIYNSSLKYHNISTNDDEFFIQESDIINNVYRSNFIRYEQLLNKYKLTTTIISDYIVDKPMLSIVIINKENWNLFYRYFSLCEFENYYFVMVAIVALGGIIGSIIFGFLSDIYGRRLIILLTLFISFIGTLGIFLLSLYLDYYYRNELNSFKEKCSSKEIICENILPDLYAQRKVNERFRNFFIYYLFCIFILNISLWPLLKTCMALIVENSRGDLEVLINFRRYNFVFQGLPPLCTSLIFVNINNFTLTFLILCIVNLTTLIFSFLFLDESIRYYYEYSEWGNLTKVLLNNFKINFNEFRTFNETEFKEFKKREKSKSFLKFNSYIYNNNSNLMKNQSYYKNLTNSKLSFIRNIKRKEEFLIKLEDIKTYPILILTSLMENNALKYSQILLIIILVLLYIIIDLFHKELLEPPYFSIKDFYFGKGFNYIINSVFFIYLITNLISNYFFYCLYRIGCFKTVIYISQFIITITLIIYHYVITNVSETTMNFNEYNFGVLTYFLRDIRSQLNLFFLFFAYFFLNGVVFYLYLLIIKISKTIHRCTFFSLHSIALIIATFISEFIYYYCENYFLFLGILNFLCLITFFFLSEFKELIYIMNDLKINYLGIRKYNWQEKFKYN